MTAAPCNGETSLRRFHVTVQAFIAVDLVLGGPTFAVLKAIGWNRIGEDRSIA
jgi:hypothetical protein